jgi:hypothetical protein
VTSRVPKRSLGTAIAPSVPSGCSPWAQRTWVAGPNAPGSLGSRSPTQSCVQFAACRTSGSADVLALRRDVATGDATENEASSCPKHVSKLRCARLVIVTALLAASGCADLPQTARPRDTKRQPHPQGCLPPVVTHSRPVDPPTIREPNAWKRHEQADQRRRIRQSRTDPRRGRSTHAR